VFSCGLGPVPASVRVSLYATRASVNSLTTRRLRDRASRVTRQPDDGSTDATASVARQAGARVLQLPFNVGVGGGIASRHAASPAGRS
jgi:hypothetical protein